MSSSNVLWHNCTPAGAIFPSPLITQYAKQVAVWHSGLLALYQVSLSQVFKIDLWKADACELPQPGLGE